MNFVNLALKSRKFYWLLLCWWLVACSDSAPRPTQVRPTAPPTPASFDNVPAAATIGANVPPGVTVLATTAAAPGFATSAPVIAATPNEEAGRGFAGENPDPTSLAQLFGTPGPGKGQSGTGQPGRAGPTPTLDFTNNPVNVASLRGSKVSFLFAYRQALLRMQATQPSARLIFATATSLTANHTSWNFLFLSQNGPKMWRVRFDADNQNSPSLDVSEQPPANLADYNAIDMNRVLDSDELVSRAEAAGVRTDLPVQIINFGLDGLTRQPAFILTNTTQGKQLVLSAYTGQVLRNEFS